MNRAKLVIALAALIPVSSCAKLANEIDASVHRLLPHARVGVIVTNLARQKIIVSRGADYRYTPASVMKILPAMTAYTKLGPNYRYITSLVSDSKRQKNGVFYGNVGIRFSYDPALTAQDVKTLLRYFKSKGITRISGHVYVDEPAGFIAPYPPGHLWDDMAYAYAAPISPVILNKNQWQLKLQPTSLGKKGRLTAKPDLGVVTLLNHTITTKGYRAGCPVRIYSQGNNRFVVSGCIPRSVKTQYRSLSYSDPYAVARRLVRNDLAAMHVRYKGAVTVRPIGSFSKTLYSIKSVPLSDLLAYMLKHSENVYADSLPMKMLTKQRNAVPTGSSYWAKAVKEMEATLRSRMGVNTKQLWITDGSGLSRYDLLTPRAVNKILMYGYNNKNLRRVWMRSLAQPGYPGTLRWRSVLIKYKVHAKTGTMSGVGGLAGYLRNKDGQEVSFVILANGMIGKRRKLTMLENDICQKIYLRS